MSTCRCDDGRPCCFHSKCANCDGSFVCKYGSSTRAMGNLVDLKNAVERDRAAAFTAGKPTCEVCGKPVREGLRFCSGMSPCLKKGIGIMDDGMSGSIKPFKADELDEYAGLCPHCGEGHAPGEGGCSEPAIVKPRLDANGDVVATDVASGATVKLTTSDDPINPNHYKQGPVELIEVFEEMGIAEDFCHGNMIKYLERAGVKNPATELEDFRKARWYAKRLVKIVGERILAKRGA